MYGTLPVLAKLYYYVFRSIFFKHFYLCVSDDLEGEDVQLKYEKRGGEVWVSLDQFKL